MSWLPSQTVSLPTYSPEGWIDDRPSHDVLEDEDHSGEDSQPGGISLSVDPTEVEGPQPMNSTPNDVALAYAPPLASHWGIPPTEAPFDNLPNPFDNSLSALSLQGTNNTHPVFAMTTVSEGLLQHALTVLGNANALQHYHSLGFDDASDLLDDELPAVNDYQAVNDVCRFIDHWAVTGGLESGADLIGRAAANVRGWDRPETVTREELQGDQYDIQGINWEKLDTTREKARSARTKLCAKKAKSQWAKSIPSTENYYRFRRMDTAHRAFVAHFQLRNLISCTSRSDIYYATKSRVMHTDASSQTESCIMDLTKPLGDPSSPSTFTLTALTASDEVLIAGGFSGEYALTNLSSEYGTSPTQGYVTHEYNGITNHVHTFQSRSGGKPQGVFCSNDQRLRVLDCNTNQLIYDFGYEQAINCSATSPNGRMRVVVGDFHETLITDAETGLPFERLRTHTDHVFACAWADDGIHVATGAQDSQVAIWDARRWGQPLAVVASVMACPRSLRFSPVGGGRRVLFSAEAEDIVNVLDAVSFDRAQTLDFYGATGGIAVTPDGAALFVANCDSKFGGILEFERVGFGEPHGAAAGRPWRGRRDDYALLREEAPWEWVAERELDDDPRVRIPARARARRGLELASLVV